MSSYGVVHRYKQRADSRNLALQGLIKRETRFTSKCSVDQIIAKIEEAAIPMGFDVKKNNFKVLSSQIYYCWSLDRFELLFSSYSLVLLGKRVQLLFVGCR